MTLRNKIDHILAKAFIGLFIRPINGTAMIKRFIALGFNQGFKEINVGFSQTWNNWMGY